MDPEIELKRICDEHQGTFKHEATKVNGSAGSTIHISKYRLTLPYRQHFITIVYDYGNSDTATFRIHLKQHPNQVKFKIKTIDHLSRFLQFKKHRYAISCSNSILKNSIKACVIKHQLDDLFENTAFELHSTGQHKNDVYEIYSVFSLKYSSHAESAADLLNFHKALIDLVLDKTP
ncbi:MAG: hypothetical protein ABJQ39_07375 [Winogradskyella arenosi]